MKKQLVSVDPIRLGIVLGVLYALIALIVVPFILLASFLSLSRHAAGFPGPESSFPVAFSGVFMAVLFPLIYGVLGFIGGIIVGLVYNLVAKITGGIEFVVKDVTPVV